MILKMYKKINLKIKNIKNSKLDLLDWNKIEFFFRYSCGGWIKENSFLESDNPIYLTSFKAQEKVDRIFLSKLYFNSEYIKKKAKSHNMQMEIYIIHFMEISSQ